ncbi:nuclear transport factor 2 family protein [Sungkyunkwania multivorans]|uniref:Nuclear transport factor 2 family protein n=1 Tax=Sungkyunkwania multivorans TaxID=1173618 RepID=A0ABW3CU16_9FLAO
MKKTFVCSLMALVTLLGCEKKKTPSTDFNGKQSQVIINMIAAVNEKDAQKYVNGFAEGVEVFVEYEKKVDGKSALKANRAEHFKNHPNVRSEIQHLVEIDNKVILHDKVWLNNADTIGSDIVEIFTFENGKVIRVDVIQPKDLFGNSE